MTSDQRSTWRFDTRLVHQGEQSSVDGEVRATVTPIYATTTFLHPHADDLDRAFDEGGLVYGRFGNPTVDGFEQAVTAVEGGAGAVAFGSGMAALHVALLAAGTPRGALQPRPCTILAAQDTYGATTTLLRQFFDAQGWPVRFCDMLDRNAVENALREQPAIVLFEPLSNPLLKVCDVPWLIEQAHGVGALVIADNTLASPVLLRPIEHGADLVVHSATKYLGGHGDVVGGVVAARTDALYTSLRRYSKLLGATLGPFEARLLARGMKTLALRVRQQSANAAIVAQWLAKQPQVARVYYPGLPTHAQHALASELFGGMYGGMLSFDLRRAERHAAHACMDALQMILPATTLGDVYTLISYSARSSHRDMPPEQRQAQGIGDGLLRLSIGIEDAGDIIDDLAQALAVVDRLESAAP